jgi:predicted nucleic acid-binding protein
MTPSELCAAHRRIAVDSNVLIYLLEGHAEFGPLARSFVRAAEKAGNRLLISALAIAETAAGPAFEGDETMADRYADAILSIPFMDVVPLGPTLAVDAAAYAGRYHLRMLDAVHLASALGAGASALLTNDRRIPPTSRLAVIRLGDLDLDPEPAVPSD